jgi:hypothetical protein
MVPQLYDRMVGTPDTVADPYVVKNCIAGDLMSCRSIDPFRSPSIAAPGSAGRTIGCGSKHSCDLTGMRRECDRGFPLSCHVLAVMESETSPQGKIDQQRTYDLAFDGCRRGLVSECRFLEPGTERDRTFATSQICLMTGYECYGAALVVGKDTTAARDLTEHECQFSKASDRSSCAALVDKYQRHVWAEPVPNRLADLRDWLCQQKNELVDDETCKQADPKRVVNGH